jgi:hypothetical protein
MSSPRSPYLVSPGYDWTFFLLPPLVSLCVGIGVAGTTFTERVTDIAGLEVTWAEFALGSLVHAHLVAVLFRSHGNSDIFRLHRWRFTVVPVLLWVAIASVPVAAISAAAVATFWDVWHSGAQTFGFARIYDRNAGVPTHVARRLDFWANQILYAGPILGGATLMQHLEHLEDFRDVGVAFMATVPAQIEGVHGYLSRAVVVGGTGFIAYYCWAHWRLYRQGYHFSPLKLFLVASTGLCSVYTWGFNSWGEAFFIMNLFHAVQYLALVWWSERGRLRARLRVAGSKANAATAVAFALPVAGYGLGVQFVDSDMPWAWSMTIVVSLMHFWYDGFVWSVARRQV